MIHEGGPEHLFSVAMLTRSQERLLRYLGGFPESLENAWDLPREISLPGLSEAMGVVRSGLNQPLNELMDAGYITVRVAHVIGGGSRRRQVYHITEAGRGWLAEHPETPSTEGGQQDTQTLDTPVLVGRTDELQALSALLKEHGKAAVGGLPGVGKTTLLRTYAESSTVRWAQVDAFMDARGMLSCWYPDDQTLPTDLEAAVERVNSDKQATLFVVDDLHLLSPRHEQPVFDFLNNVQAAGHAVVIVGRLPLPDALDWPLLRLSTLEPEDAMLLLGEHLEEAKRMAVAKALGGHPMALQLYREGDPLPEAGEDVQAFVEHTMLNSLNPEERHALDTMVLFPRPISTDMAPSGDFIATLDDHALLRWTDNATRCEVQHLVRNVRRTMLGEHELRGLHEDAVAHWGQHAEDPAFAVLLLYHKMALDSEDLAGVMARDFDRLVVAQGAALASIFDSATQQRPDDEQLHYWAGKIALQRHEKQHARNHLEQVQSDTLRDELAYQLALLEGDEDEAERLLEQQLGRSTSHEHARLLLNASVQHLEDRVFNEAQSVDRATLQRLLNEVELPDNLEWRASMTVTMSLIQHTLALLEGDEARANSLVDGLEAIGHEADPIVLHMRLKTLLRFPSSSEKNEAQHLVSRAMDAQPTPFHRAVVGLTFAEHLVKSGDEAAGDFFAELPVPEVLEAKGNPHARYAARWWYLLGHLDEKRALMALRESSRWFRQAGCHRAARAAAARLHRLL